MSDAPETTASDQLTTAESKIILGVLKHLSSDIQADFDAIAAELGYKSAEVAKVRWRQVRNKRFPLGERASSAPSGGIDKANSSKKTPVKAKKAGTGQESQESPTTTPTTTTPKKRGRKSKAKSKDVDADDDDVAIKSEEQVMEENAGLAESVDAEEAETGSAEGE
nr:hypothetical protein CFP56_34988 [Quercus suber]